MNATSFTANRARLFAALLPGSIAVINANDIMPSNGDGTVTFRQNSDLYWLTGILQEETALVLFPDHPEPACREMLFVKHADPDFVRWNGHRLSLEEAAATSGVRNVYWSHELWSRFYQAAVYAEHIYLNSIEHPRSVNEVPTRDDRFVSWCQGKFRLHDYKRLAPILGRLRLVKSEEELTLMREACRISGLGFRRLLRFVRPGVREKQIAAELIHEYMQHDGDWAGYDPIIASGADSCILHYTSNHKVCGEGALLLIDAAASYRGYNADLTRTIPVNGRYTDRQRQVYAAVRTVQRELMKFARAGRLMREINDYCRGLLLEQLRKLGLCSDAAVQEHGAAYWLDRYCYHDFGHFLGLDIHDTGNKYEPLPENAVITIEPGIYIREEGIGVRIENNVQVVRDGTLDLMEDIPVEAEEIEALMNGE